jgi:hypothetical protein
MQTPSEQAPIEEEGPQQEQTSAQASTLSLRQAPPADAKVLGINVPETKSGSLIGKSQPAAKTAAPASTVVAPVPGAALPEAQRLLSTR